MIELLFAAAIAIQGEWHKPCQSTSGGSGQTETLTISGENWHREFFFSQDQQCRQEPFLVIRHHSSAMVENPDLELKTVRITYEPRTSGQAAIMRAMEFCGIEDWELNTERDVSGHECEGFRMPEPGERVYSILKHEESSPERLWLGKKTPSADGTIPESRHRELEALPFERLD